MRAPRARVALLLVDFLVAIAAVVLGAGPAAAGLNQWTSGGPPDVSVLSLAIDPLTPAAVYAGTNGDGIFLSPNGGGVWIPINAGLANPVVTAIAINPQKTAVVYAGTRGDGVFRTVNGGASWTPVNNGLANRVVTALAINPISADTLYAGTDGGGVWKSVDGGNSWTPANSGLPAGGLVSALAINPQTPTTLFAALRSQGVFRSVNAGASWVGFGNAAGLPNLLLTSLAIDPIDPTTLYAGTTGLGVFKSITNGQTWFPVNNGVTNINPLISSLAVDPTVPSIVYASAPGTGVLRTTSGGASWAVLFPQVPNTIVNTLAVTPAGACVHAGTGGTGVFDFEFAPNGCSPIPIVAAVLPASRSVLVGAPATFFATMINPSLLTATICGITLASDIPATLTFQTTDPQTNQPVGAPNVPASIPPQGTQTFVLALIPSGPIPPTDVRFNFSCNGTSVAPVVTGVNTLLFSASTTPVPDIVVLAAANGGIVDVPGLAGTGAFAVATVNLGSAAAITVSADTGGVPLPLELSICETDPVSQCLGPTAPTVTRTFNPFDTPTFAIFVRAFGFVSFEPGVHRVFVRFRDAGGEVRGATSVAVRTVLP
jgi:photosystem II stability/assembly factor-like uncharacterized protein